MIKKRYITIAIHLSVWICLMLVPFIFIPLPDSSVVHFDSLMLFRILWLNLFLIGFYYFNSLVLIPRLLANRKVILYVSTIVALLAIYLLQPVILRKVLPDSNRPRSFVIMQNPPPMPGEMQPSPTPLKPGPIARRFPFFPFAAGQITLFALTFVVSLGIRVIDEWFKSESRNKTIESEKLATELSFLKSQINPHFLFNTLNNIYLLVIKKSDKAPDAILKLSNIMRYVLNESKEAFVPLEDEIEHLKQYIDLHRLRFTNKVELDFMIQGDYATNQIAPLLLIPFVENAFKYGVSAHEQSPIRILIQVNQNKLTLQVENRKFVSNPLFTEQYGIGLKNTRRRLDLLYPDRYTLETGDVQGDVPLYRVNLQMELI